MGTKRQKIEFTEKEIIMMLNAFDSDSKEHKRIHQKLTKAKKEISERVCRIKW